MKYAYSYINDIKFDDQKYKEQMENLNKLLDSVLAQMINYSNEKTKVKTLVKK